MAAKALEADNRSLTAASGIALFFGGAFATIVGSNDLSALKGLTTQSGTTGLGVIAGSSLIVAFLLIHYFAHLQRSAVHAARKIVVLRRLLGLDYGNIETVLPADTLDGANEPFAIVMFPGWLSLQAIPAITVALVTGLAQFVIFSAYEAGGVSVLSAQWHAPFLFGPIAILVVLMIYRIALLEKFETIRFIVARGLAWLLRTPLKLRTGHVLYRLKLAIAEAYRIGLDLKQMHDLLLYIEDRQFFRHNGNSFRAVISAVYRRVRYGTVSGGSTILQQLVRTNFLQRLNAPVRRKIVEWMLAPWLNGRLEKREALDAYLVSVRFAASAYGLADGIRHFFPDQSVTEPLPGYRKFILIERLSNVTATFPQARIRKLVTACIEKGLLCTNDVQPLNEAYKRLGAERKIDLAGQLPDLNPEE